MGEEDNVKEQYEENMKMVHRWNRQARILSVIAFVLSIISLITRILERFL